MSEVHAQRHCRPHRATIEWLHSCIRLAAMDMIHWAGCQLCGVSGPMAPGEPAHCLNHCNSTLELADLPVDANASRFPPEMQDAVWAAYRIGGVEGVILAIAGLGWCLSCRRWEALRG